MSVAPAATLDEAKTYLRIEDASEDATIARLIGVATALGERFTGQLFMGRDVAQALPAEAAWTRLAGTPVRSIAGVAALAPDGTASALPVGGYAIDIDADGDGWVRVMQPGIARVRVAYRAGLAEEAGELPESLRQGVIRLAAHLFAHRDDADEGAPPAAVAALWRPWRRMRLAGATAGGVR